MHEARAERPAIGNVGQEFRMDVGHSHVVDQDAHVEILQPFADRVVNLASASEIDVNDTRLDSILQLCPSIQT